MLLLMYWLQNFSFKLRIGNGNLASNDHDDHVEIREILNVTIHPAFDGGSTLYYDLAVVKTQPLEIGTVKYFPKKSNSGILVHFWITNYMDGPSLVFTPKKLFFLW